MNACKDELRNTVLVIEEDDAKYIKDVSKEEKLPKT